MACVGHGLQKLPTFSVKIGTSNSRFLTDSGAVISIASPSFVPYKNVLTLFSKNFTLSGESIRVHGEVKLLIFCSFVKPFYRVLSLEMFPWSCSEFTFFIHFIYLFLIKFTEDNQKHRKYQDQIIQVSPTMEQAEEQNAPTENAQVPRSAANTTESLPEKLEETLVYDSLKEGLSLPKCLIYRGDVIVWLYSIYKITHLNLVL